MPAAPVRLDRVQRAVALVRDPPPVGRPLRRPTAAEDARLPVQLPDDDLVVACLRDVTVEDERLAVGRPARRVVVARGEAAQASSIRADDGQTLALAGQGEGETLAG